ncbi:hypothetical protein LNP74_28095 [Klebsiella pneumoniae subsp. pneumoniae]|nr:hypothetical protein [Klebsiella pneumoniae subsp. pneumoniae]
MWPLARHWPCMQGINLPNNTMPISPASIWCAITTVSTGSRAEDNSRTPSGVSYMLENRKMMMRLYPGDA